MSKQTLPPPIRFLLLHAASGFGLAFLFTLGLIWTDPGGLGTLLQQAPDWPLPSVLLWFVLGLTFGSVQMGSAIMFLAAPPHSDASGGESQAVDWSVAHHQSGKR